MHFSKKTEVPSIREFGFSFISSESKKRSFGLVIITKHYRLDKKQAKQQFIKSKRKIQSAFLRIFPLLRSTANAPILWKIAPVTGEITPAAARKIITKLTENAITILA